MTDSTPIENRGYAHPEVLVSTQWVADHNADDNVRIVESDEDILLYEVGHIAGDGDRRPGHGQLGDGPHAAAAALDGGPYRLGAEADGAGDSHAGDDDFVHDLRR